MIIAAVMTESRYFSGRSDPRYAGFTDHSLKIGDVEKGFAASAHIVEGEVRCGGQVICSITD